MSTIKQLKEEAEMLEVETCGMELEDLKRAVEDAKQAKSALIVTPLENDVFPC